MHGLNVIVKLNADAQKKFDQAFKDSVRPAQPAPEKKS